MLQHLLRPWQVFILTLALMCSHAGMLPAQQAGDRNDTLFRRLTIPPVVDSQGQVRAGSGISQMAIEPRGSLWIMANQGVFYWDGTAFRRPVGEDLRTGMYLAGFFGGGDRPLYCTQPVSTSPNQGRLYKLADGAATLVTDFYYNVSHERPDIYVAKSGQILNWGKLFLATFDGQAWKRHEVSLTSPLEVVEHSSGLHCFAGKRIITVTPDGELVQRELENLTDTRAASAVLWGDNRVLLADHLNSKLSAYELPGFKPVDISQVCKTVGDSDSPMFRAPDRSVWLLRYSQERGFVRLSAEGELTPVENLNMVRWSNMRVPAGFVLFAKDGSTWLITDNSGLVRHQDGQQTKLGWRDGLPEGGARSILQDAAGNIFVGYHHSLFMIRADGQRSPLPAWTRAWQEHALARYRPVQDLDGNLWMALASQPGSISSWNGKEFTHRKVSFDTRQIYGLLVDDQQHLLVSLPTQPANARYFDVGPDDEVAFESLEALLVAAVKRGARQFAAGIDISGPLVDGERIWYSLRNSERIRYFNGDQWVDLRGYSDLHRSRDGLLFSNTKQVARFDKGVLVPLLPDERAENYWMHGPNGLLPFEPAIYAKAPQEYLLVERQSRKIVVPELDAADLTRPWKFQPGEERPQYMSFEVRRGAHGSLLSCYAASHMYRLLSGNAIVSDFRDTPLIGQDHITENLFDDRAGNLWIHHRTNSMFMKSTQKFRLVPPAVPERMGRYWTAKLSATDALGNVIAPTLFWQSDQGPWMRCAEPGKLELFFSKEGQHRVKVVAVGPQAEFTPQPLELICNVQRQE